MIRSLALAALALFAAAGPAAAQYRQPAPYRPPVVNYNGGGWYAGGYPGGMAGGVRYTAPIYSGTALPYSGGYPANTGFYVPPVYQPYRTNYNTVGVPNFGYTNYGYGFRYGY